MCTLLVSLHAREWIEMSSSSRLSPCIMVSLHAREWIEIHNSTVEHIRTTVSLHAREWIEIKKFWIYRRFQRSLSMRESGLKF